MVKKTFKITGMHCNSCSGLIESTLKDKVNNIKASYYKEEAIIDFDEKKISEKEIKDLIKQAGYEASDIKEKQAEKTSEEKSEKFGFYFMIASFITLGFFMYKIISKLDIAIPSLGEKGSLLLLFLVGILTGFHCISMCGGFVVSYTSKNALKGHKGFGQHLAYGGAKVISYTIIGGLFGLVGGFIAFSVGLRSWVAVLAGTFMIFYALSMFGFSFFRRFQFNPKFLTRFAIKAGSSAKGPYKAPIVTGLLNGLFIACGPLQAMYLYAAGTGGLISGATSLMAFGLGTLPVMLGFGSLATVISHKTTKKILKLSAIIVLILGIVMLNRGLSLMGSPISYNSIKDNLAGKSEGASVLIGDTQLIKMTVDKYGWEPNSFVLKKGIPVRWEITVEELTSCNNEIIVRDYNLDIKLKKGLNVVEFTPTEAKVVRWSCWMGMIPGSFVVTENGQATDSEISSATPQSSGSCGGSCGSATCGGASGGSCGCGGAI